MPFSLSLLLSIDSYRSMLSVVFRFVLPELSSHFVLRDLLRSFRLERPFPSCCAPPWDLSLVLSFLRGPPFEPLSSCSLRDLTRKVLFLLSLATTRGVGKLQAFSSQVSFSGNDLFLSYLPEFRVKTETSVRPLPHSFPVRSLRDFVGALADEPLLCPVGALRLYLSCTASFPSRPPSLFVSLRSPSRSFSKNALSFFICELIAEAYSSTGRSLPSAPSSSSSLSLCLCVLVLRFVCMGCVGLRRLGLFTATLLWLSSLSLLLGVLLPPFLPSTFPMFSSPCQVVMVWVLWWRLVLWFEFICSHF